MLFTGCTPGGGPQPYVYTGNEPGALTVSTRPLFFDVPYYYEDGRYYYGGTYGKGVFSQGGKRFDDGHYYDGQGYRYHGGVKYAAEYGRYGHYENANQYFRYHSTYK